MKSRIIVILSISTVIAGVGWLHSQRLSELRERQRKAQLEVKQLGLESLPVEEVVHKSDRSRERKASDSKPSVAATISFIVDFEAAKKLPGDTREKSRERYRKLLELLNELNASQIRSLINEIRSHEDFSEIARKSHEWNAYMSLINRSPGEGLDLYVETRDKSEEQSGIFQVERVLTSWATKDPDAALDWIRRNLTKHPEFINDSAKSEVIEQIATKDRKLAFQLIDELGIETPATATQAIMSSAKTEEEKIAAISDLREYLPKIKDRNERFRAGDYAIALIGANFAKDGFQTATQWAESANLTDTELASFGSSFGRSIKDGEQAKWMEWFGKKLPDGLCARPIRQVMLYWADEDYKAAGAWINSTPDGTMKHLAISTYASTVSDFEPDAAVQWAITLPPGKLRDDTLHKIYHNWPKKDAASEAAAAAFEQRYQIKHDH